jgi:hypothetical protein
MNKTKEASDFIISEFSSEGTTTMILKNNTYLSNVLTKMPHGLIAKEQTGMGATTLELHAKRNSIIVEPLRVTASLKAKESKEYLYFGSDPNKSSVSNLEKKLEKLLDNTGIEHKKIVVVADSLPRLVKMLEQKKLLNSFFLMIDESDSFQLDSSFRPAMEACYRIYKKHPQEKRCMVTATPIKFHDPEIKDEPCTVFKFKEDEKRNLTVFYTDNNYLGACFDKIEEHISSFKDDKVVLALNNVTDLVRLANKLVEKDVLKMDEIAILCGANSKENCSNFYNLLDSETLPAKVNLITSAYYTGFDIKESYRLLVVVKNNDRLNQHSVSRLKQIVGRCRKPHKILSEEVIYSSNDKVNTEKMFTETDLFELAETQLKILNCLKSHLSSSTIFNEHNASIQEHLLDSDKLKLYGFDLLTKTQGGDYEISYLAIDAILELQNNVFNVYQKKELLADRLRKDGHTVNEDGIVSSISFGASSSRLTKKNRITSLKDKLLQIKDHDPYLGYDKTIKVIGTSELEKQALYLFAEYSEYLNKEQLIEKIIKESERGGISGLKNLNIRFILALVEKHPLAQAIDSQFKVGETYTTKEKHDNLKFAYQQSKLNTETYNEQKQSQLLNTLFEFKGNRNANVAKGKKKGDKLVAKKKFEIDIVKPIEYSPDQQRKFRVRDSDLL